MNSIEEEPGQEPSKLMGSEETVADQQSSRHSLCAETHARINPALTPDQFPRQYDKQESDPLLGTGSTATPQIETPPNWIPADRRNSIQMPGPGSGVLSNLIKYMALQNSSADLSALREVMLSRRGSTNPEHLRRGSTNLTELRTSPEFRRGSVFTAERRASIIKVGNERKASVTSAFAGKLGGKFAVGKGFGGKGETHKMANIDVSFGIDPDMLRDAIALNIEQLLKRQDFLMKLCKGFWMYGSPSYRLEHFMDASSAALNVDASFAFFPGMLLMSFGDTGRRKRFILSCVFEKLTIYHPSLDTHTSETHFLKVAQGYNLGKLEDVNTLAATVVAMDEEDMDIDGAIDSLDEVLLRPNVYSPLILVFNAGAISFILCLMAFNGTWEIAFIALFEGLLVGGLSYLASKHRRYGNLLELTSSMCVGFIARFSHVYIPNACFWTLTLSGVVHMLPGLGLTMSVTELAAKYVNFLQAYLVTSKRGFD